jgi:hypothetical protein
MSGVESEKAARILNATGGSNDSLASRSTTANFRKNVHTGSNDCPTATTFQGADRVPAIPKKSTEFAGEIANCA